jgi:PEP-CTERM motif
MHQGGKTGGGPFYIGTGGGASIRLTDQHQGIGTTMPTGLTTLLYLFTEGSQKFFINGNLVYSGTGNYTMDSGDTYTRLGSQFGGPSEYWNGTISQVQIFSNITASDLATGAVPEPSTYALFGIGALALVMAYRRKVA